MSNETERRYRIYPKSGAAFTIKAKGPAKAFEGMVIFHDETGHPIAAFSVAELIGFWEESALIADSVSE